MVALSEVAWSTHISGEEVGELREEEDGYDGSTHKSN